MHLLRVRILTDQLMYFIRCVCVLHRSFYPSSTTQLLILHPITWREELCGHKLLVGHKDLLVWATSEGLFYKKNIACHTCRQEIRQCNAHPCQRVGVCVLASACVFSSNETLLSANRYYRKNPVSVPTGTGCTILVHDTHNTLCTRQPANQLPGIRHIFLPQCEKHEKRERKERKTTYMRR